VLVPLEQFATREASRNRHVWTHDRWVWMALIGVGFVLGVAFVWATDQRFFGGEPIYIVQIGVMMIGYGVLFLGRGILAGQRRFGSVGILLATESVLRLAVAFVILEAGGDAVALGWSMAAGPLMMLIVPFWRRPEGEPIGERTESPSPVPGGLCLGHRRLPDPAGRLAAGGEFPGGNRRPVQRRVRHLHPVPGPAHPDLLTAGKASLDAGALHRSGGASSGSGVQLPDRRRRVLLTGVAWQVGRLIGPDIISFLFGPEFDPSSQVTGLVAAGMVAASAAQITGQVLVAEGATGRLAKCLGDRTGLALLALVGLDGEPDVVVAASFALGELGALCMVGFTVIRSHRADRFTSPQGEHPVA
jgi:hypothetical protein